MKITWFATILPLRFIDRELYHRRRGRQRKYHFIMNSRFFRLCRAYSNSLKTSKVGEFPRSWFVGDNRCRLFTSSIKREIRDVQAVVVQ